MNMRAKVSGADTPLTSEKVPSAEAPQADNVAALKTVETPRGSASPKKRGNGRRFLLLVSVPLVIVVAAGYFWLSGGRYVSTDNAYVEQADVAISADVPGKISQVLVRENEQVHAGDVLFRIDPASYKIAVEVADAALAQARLEVQQLQASYKTARAKLRAARATDDIQHRALARAEDLGKKGYATPAKIDQARLAVTQADNGVALAKQAVDSAVAALGGNPDLPVDRQPAVLTALANKAKAELDLARTTVRAPVDGVVSQVGKLNVGQYVSEGTQMVSLVETGDTWVRANFKETQLTHVAPGQKVDVGVDTYPDLDLHGTVQSIGAATGAQFSLIPAQNASGNWVKVVQRIPVRIKIDPKGAKILRSGMSSSVSVDTGKTRFDRIF